LSLAELQNGLYIYSMDSKATPNSYAELYRKSLESPEVFWAEAAQKLVWRKPWDKVLDHDARPVPRWFKGGKINICENALDRHVSDGRGDQIALIYDSAVTKVQQKWTYHQLRDEVARVAGGLRALGVAKGDRVILYMPMVPEALMAMLACARLGAIHSVVFGGFAPAELAARIDDAQPKVILTSAGAIEAGKIIEYKPLVDQALSLASFQPPHLIVKQRTLVQGKIQNARDLDWDAWLKNAVPAEFVEVDAWDPNYILYTSGTTGRPKGIVRDTGGHAVALHWSMEAIYGVKSGEVFWTASDVGWVVGHSYIVYAPLLKGATTILYEGKPIGTPDAGAFWRVIEEHHVNVFFTAPTAIRAIKREDPNGLFHCTKDVGTLRAVFLAGERSDSATLEWLERLLQVPVIDHWWQTETGWAITANCQGIEPFKIKHGSSTKPVPGWNVQVLDDGGHPIAAGKTGSLVCKLPLPPGSLPTLWHDEERFRKQYLEEFPGYYATADAGLIDEDGYVFVLSRTDDIINVAGHRLSTGVMEEALANLPEVAECAVVGMKDALKGEVPIGILVLKKSAEKSAELIIQEAIQHVRNVIGPVASFKIAYIVKRLPKTRSGKILRGTIKKIADREEFKMPATIDEPSIIEEIRRIITAGK